MKEIKKVLVANRGEIACRVIRSIKEMGIKTVAVYSEADRNAMHVRLADEAIMIGPAPSSKSYLVIDNILKAAKETDTDAIHPGYGFLSENATFARKVEEAGIIFIGPSAKAIEVMGSKLAAKQAVASYDIPLVPGAKEAITDIPEAKKLADEIGYPILIKASAGGGGKGMRLVDDPSEFEEQMERAISEAKSAFGDGSVFIEKFITSPKHIEVQILGDQHGNIVYLFERECSIQRRHQKVVEEAPSAVVTPEIRKKMGEAAVNVARACSYHGAGTVEFVVDKNLNFYFLEMNTRLQVEHPVTELITGKDLVKEQIRIAEGKPISFKQEDLTISGHALEVRVYAEDPANNFLPDTGSLEVYERPQGPGVRVDDGYEQGMDIPIYYDPMIAKLIVHAPTREDAIHRMVQAIDNYKIVGVETTLSFCRFAIQHESFVSGAFDTNFVANFFKPEELNSQNFSEEELQIALASAFKVLSEVGNDNPTSVATSGNRGKNWKNRLQH